MSINNQQYIGDIHVMTAKNNKIKPKKFINHSCAQSFDEFRANILLYIYLLYLNLR